MNGPLASVIVPVHNGARYIEQCICNLLEQSYENVELIIVNDGSTDETEDICKKLAENANEKLTILTQDMQGVSVARNKGLDVSKGKYVFFADVDDSLELNTIERCVGVMEKDSPDLLVFGYFFDIPGEKGDGIDHISNTYEGCFFHNKSEICEKLVDLYDANMMYNVWNKVFRKGIIERNSIRFTVGKVYNEDRDFVRDYLLNTDSLEVIPDCYYHYFRDSRSTTGVYRENLFEIRKEEYFRLLDFFFSIGLADGKMTEYVSRQHIERVMGCVENLFVLLDEKESKENRDFIKSEIRKIVCDEITVKAVNESIPKSKKMKIMTVPYKAKSVNGVYLMTYFIHKIKEKYPQLFHKLKQAR